MKVDLHSCFILHTRPYRETSLIVDVFSSKYGRVSLVARGVKRRSNNQGLLLQPGRKLNISWSMRTELGTMICVETNGPAYNLRGTRLISCFYMNELLVRMLHKDETHPELFDTYERSMVQLQQEESEDRVLRFFEKHLLKSLGYGLVLDHEMDTGDEITSDKEYFYQIEYGPVRQQPRNVRNLPVSGKTLVALHTELVWDEHISREAKELFRMILALHTGDKPIASRDLYKAYIKNTSLSNI